MKKRITAAVLAMCVTLGSIGISAAASEEQPETDTGMEMDTAAVKAAAGGCEYMNVVRVVNLNRTLEELKERGVWIVGTTLSGENALRADLTGPIALVIGSEDTGIADLTLKKCDRLLSLPMAGHLDSLNASVAAGVMMYAVMNARRG